LKKLNYSRYPGLCKALQVYAVYLTYE